MTYFEAYLLTRLDSFGHFFCILFGISIIFFGISGIIWAVGEGEWEDSKKKEARKRWLPVVKYLLIVTAVSGFIFSLIPTTKEAAFIYLAPAIVNNKDIQKTIKKIPELSGLGLEYLGEILKSEIYESKKEIIKKVNNQPKE